MAAAVPPTHQPPCRVRDAAPQGADAGAAAGHRAVGERAGRRARREPHARCGRASSCWPRRAWFRCSRRWARSSRASTRTASRDAQFLREAVELAALDDVPAELDPDVVAELRANLDRQRAPGHRPRGVLRPRRGVPPRPAAAQRARAGLVDRGVGEGSPRPRAPARAEGDELARRRSPTSTSRSSTRSWRRRPPARPRARCARTCGRSSTTSSGIRQRAPELFADGRRLGAGPAQRRRLGVTAARGCAAA